MYSRISFALFIAAAAILSPRPAESQPRADSLGILEAVVAQLELERARDDSARAEACGPTMPRLCLPRVTPVWYVRSEAAMARTLAGLLKLPAEVEVAGKAEPACPWPSDLAPPGAGLRTDMDLELFSASVAHVTFRQSCDNPRGYMHDLYVRESRFTIRREGKSWSVEEVTTIVS